MSPNHDPTAISSALQAFILADPSAAHTAAQLAKHAGLSTITLKKLLLDNYGLTVQQFITTIRMKKASELLLENITIKDVCIQAGYSDLASFYRSFKKFFGLTPFQYRHKHANR